MPGVINHTNLLPYAWAMIRPYILEMPGIILAEHKLLNETKFVFDTLTSPLDLCKYMLNVSIDKERKDSQSGFGITSPICKTDSYKDTKDFRKLSEIIDVFQITQGFMELFSTRNQDLKEDYKDGVLSMLHEYRDIPFYYVCLHDVAFESFRDLVKYFDALCSEFTFDVVMTKNMLEVICGFIPAVISKHFALKYMVAPSYLYKNLLPLYPVMEKSSGKHSMLVSMPIDNCFMHLDKEIFEENQTQKIIDRIIDEVYDALSKPTTALLSENSIFNTCIVNENKKIDARLKFTIKKNINLGNSNVSIYSNNAEFKEFLTVITIGKSLEKYIYITDGLYGDNIPPLSMTALQVIAVSPAEDCRPLSEPEEKDIRHLINKLKLIIK